MSNRSGRGRVTLADVARQAGVSVATVSLILADRKGWVEQFRPETVETVRRVAARLGYRANIFASGLPTQGSRFFALVLSGTEHRAIGTWHHWGFEGALLAGAIEEAAKTGVYSIPTIAGTEAGEQDLQRVYQIIDGGVFGTVVRTPGGVLERFLRTQMKRGRRVVAVFPRRLASWSANAIDVDNRAIGETAGDMLVRRQRRRWALVRYKSRRESWSLRIAGLKRKAEQAGAEVRDIVVPTELDESQVADVLGPRLKRMKPDGLFAIDSVSAAGSALAAHRFGLTVAEDLDMIGCDCAAWRISSLPTMTAIDVSWDEVGALALRQLLWMCESGETRFETILMPPRIVVGDSCPVPQDEASLAARCEIP